MNKDTLWWVSFASGGKNHGIVLATGSSIEEAVAACTLHNCNPGGEALGMPILPGVLKKNGVAAKWFRETKRFTLLHVEDLPAFLQPTKLDALEADGYDMAGIADFVCQECNTRLKIGEEHTHKIN